MIRLMLAGALLRGLGISRPGLAPHILLQVTWAPHRRRSYALRPGHEISQGLKHP